MDTEEAGALLKSLVAKSLDLKKFLPRLVSAMLRTVFNDIFGKSRTDSRDIAQKVTTCCI